LSRREEKDVSTLLQAGAELIEGQKEALAGEGTEKFDRASRVQREAIRRLTRAAEGVLDEAGHSTGAQTLERIASSLRSASVDERGRELLARGRLSEDVESTGLSMLAGMVGTTTTRSRPKQAREVDERAAARERTTEARERVKTARATEREMRRIADEEEREARRAREAAEKADARARSAAAEADLATEAREQAERELGRLNEER
jgi:hypothetical protein